MICQPGVLLQGPAAVRQMEAMKAALAQSKHQAPSSLSALLRACPDAFRMQARVLTGAQSPGAVVFCECSNWGTAPCGRGVQHGTQCTAQVERQFLESATCTDTEDFLLLLLKANIW